MDNIFSKKKYWFQRNDSVKRGVGKAVNLAMVVLAQEMSVINRNSF